jgi:hypothetical protein
LAGSWISSSDWQELGADVVDVGIDSFRAKASRHTKVVIRVPAGELFGLAAARGLCRQLAEDKLWSGPLTPPPAGAAVWTSPEKEGKKEENYQATKARSTSSPAKAAADGFHLGSVEFCQFRCFHILVVCFLSRWESITMRV